MRMNKKQRQINFPSEMIILKDKDLPEEHEMALARGIRVPQWDKFIRGS